ncbi:flagellar basal body rod protein FlgC [Acidobacteria bacterium AB60]|nr:flagellar basal body rod protein FlgC [Acidobacteria bacterium AB60]
MNLFGLMETSASAMQAERVRAEVVAANMANAETTRTISGGPYHRRHVVFAANVEGASFANVFSDSSRMRSIAPPLALVRPSASAEPAGGVHIAQVIEDPAPPLQRYDPSHPDAGPDGYVSYPDINPITEMVDLMGATRAYGLNGSAIQAEKGMISAALEIVKY